MAVLYERVALIGLGLIAGSMAHAMRAGGLAGRITGVAEVWLEPFDDGTIVHHYVRGTTRALTARSARAAVAAHSRRNCAARASERRRARSGMAQRS